MIYLDGAMSLTVEAGEPRFRGCGMGVEGVSRAEAKERGIRANIASLHAAASEHHDDQGQGLGKLFSSILAKMNRSAPG